MQSEFDYKDEYEKVVKSLERLKKILGEFKEYSPEEEKAWGDFKIAVKNFEKYRQKRANDKVFDPDNPFN